MYFKKTVPILSLITIALTSAPSIASSGTAKQGFHGNGEAGFSDSTGNTVSTSIYGALKLNYDQSDNQIKSTFEVNYKSENNVQTQERYLVDLQNNRFYNSERSYFSYIGGQFEKSRFEGIDFETTLSIGLGRSLLKNDASQLTGELGIGQNSIRYTTASGGDQTQQTIARMKLDFKHTFNQQVTFVQDLTNQVSKDQTKTESNTGFKIKIADQMNLKLAYKYRHNNKPAAGVEKTDTQTAITLIYDF